MSEDTSPAGATRTSRRRRWRHKFRKLLLVIVCAEVGIILLVFPWLDIWGENFLSSGSADWYSIWMNSYFRGAVSGLGAVNIYISFMELVRFFMPDPRS